MSKCWQIVCPTCGEQLEIYAEEDLMRLYELERKEWQRKGHAAFDPIWKSGIVDRGLAYSWLARELGIEYADCHFAEMSIPQLKRAVEVCELAKAKMLKAFCESKWDKYSTEPTLPKGNRGRIDLKTTGVDMCTPVT